MLLSRYFGNWFRTIYRTYMWGTRRGDTLLRKFPVMFRATSFHTFFWKKTSTRPCRPRAQQQTDLSCPPPQYCCPAHSRRIPTACSSCEICRLLPFYWIELYVAIDAVGGPGWTIMIWHMCIDIDIRVASSSKVFLTVVTERGNRFRNRIYLTKDENWWTGSDKFKKNTLWKLLTSTITYNNNPGNSGNTFHCFQANTFTVNAYSKAP